MKPEIGKPYIIVVKAATVLNESGLYFSKGEAYQFKADGRWRDFFIPHDADGYENAYMNLFDKKKRFSGAKWFALIGCIDKTGDFLIGCKTDNFHVEHDGFFNCYANDVKGFYWNNSGKLLLTVTRIK